MPHKALHISEDACMFSLKEIKAAKLPSKKGKQSINLEVSGIYRGNLLQLFPSKNRHLSF